MLTPKLEKIIPNLPGREIKGRLNEMMILILLIKNYDAALAYKNTKSFGFRGRKDRQIIKEGITTAVISKELKIMQSTVATTVNRLSKHGWVTHSKGNPVFTTDTGRNKAREYLRHHRLLEVLFVNCLGLSSDEAHNQATKFMLLVDCEFVNTIFQRYTPKACPCGEEIPESDLCGSTILI